MVGPQVKQKNTCSCESHNKEETETTIYCCLYTDDNQHHLSPQR